MNILESFRKEFDISLWDYGDKKLIDEKLIAIREEAKKNGATELVREIQMEYEFFCINKSTKDGLTSKFSQSGKDKEGNEVKFAWPDAKSFTEPDWQLLEKRFAETLNPYGKYEYGMLLLVGERKKDNKIVNELLNSVLSLSKSYLAKSLNDDKNISDYVLYLRHILKNGFLIALNRHKSNAEIGKKYKEIKDFIYNTLIIWDIYNISKLRLVADYTGLISEYLFEFNGEYNLDAVLEKNWEAAVELRKTYEHGAIYIAEVAEKLAHKIKKDRVRWHRLIAECYEAMALKREDFVAPEFFVKALKYYKNIDDKTKLTELHLKLNEAKKKLNLKSVSYELPKDLSEKIFEDMVSQIRAFTPDQIIGILSSGEMLPNFSEHKSQQRHGNNMMLSKIIHTSVFDKHGNKNIVLNPEKTEEGSVFYSSYSLMFQMPSQIYLSYFIEAIKFGKLNSEMLIKWFRDKSWLCQEIIRISNGDSKSVIPFDILEPGIVRMMEEFQKYFDPKKTINESDLPMNSNFVCAIDSLAPKIEYILRIILEEKMGVPTTYIKDDGTWEEMTLTALLSSLRNKINEQKTQGLSGVDHLLDDIHYFDFILNHKAGLNIRNRVSHAHLDRDEYSPLKAVLILSVYLRIATYQFNSASNSK